MNPDLMNFPIDDMLSAEKEAEKFGVIMAGMDEAGRGPLMGPVVAAAVIMPYGEAIPEVTDSKKLSEKKREALYEIIIEKALAYGVGIVDNKRIDEIGIGNAVREAFTMAADALKIRPDVIYNDEVKWVYGKVPNRSIIKGDLKVYSISAASIIAKVTRDRIVREYDKEYPQYGFEKHKGYGTKAHFDAIREYGITPLHRKSFLTKNHAELLGKEYDG
ncbi:MAG: ribonuclease HII [Christensenellaceae bacterium]|nr:ribonuclease HII [Christensenellaceae bacterium]